MVRKRSREQSDERVVAALLEAASEITPIKNNKPEVQVK